MNEPNEEAPTVNAKTGILLLLAGAGLTGYFVIWAIWQAQHHVPEISYSVKGSGMGVLFLILGAMFLIAPQKTAALLKLDKNNLKLKDVLLLGGFAILGLALVVAMDLYFSSMGYR
jgi:hypothetical protein